MRVHLPILALVSLAACKSTPLDEVRGTLPMVVVDTNGQEMGRKAASIEDDTWVSATTSVHRLDDGGRASLGSPADYDGPSAIHVRGNSSREYDKVSYRLELRDRSGEDLDASLLGMPAEADWVLQGPYSDKSLIRNHLIYSLSRDIGRYAPRTAFVELYVVDDQRAPSTRHYRGIYVLTERVERDDARVALTKLEPQHQTEPEITGGYLLKRDWAEDEQTVRTPVYRDLLIVDDPGELTAAQRTWLEGWLADFEGALSGPAFTDPVGGYRAYADVDSFIDHMLLVELGRNVDGYVLSTWMHKDREGLLTMGPIWDYNGALGNADYFQAQKTAGWHHENPEFPEDNPNGFAWYERMLEDPAFLARRAERWRMHRAGPLSDEAVLARIAESVVTLEGAVDANFDKWPVLGRYVWPNDEGAEDRTTWEEEIRYLEGWVLQRMAWMDGAVE